MIVTSVEQMFESGSELVLACVFAARESLSACISITVIESSAQARRACQWCGLSLDGGHGNRRYHPGDCSTAARKARQRANQAAYRQRLNPSTDLAVPPDFRVGRVTVRSVVMPGEDTAALRAAALPVMRSALAFHDALKTVPFSDVLNSQELGRLRSFVDDTLTLIETLNDRLPVADVDSDLYDASDGLEIVKRLWRGQSRPGRRQAVR